MKQHAYIVLQIFITTMLLTAPAVFAADPLTSIEPITDGGAEVRTDVTAEFKGLNLIKADVNDPTLGIPVIAGRLLGQIMIILGSLALIVFVYAGIRWMVSIGQGKGDSAKSALNILKWAVIGLILIFMSYIIVSFVLDALYRASGAPIGGG